MNLQKYKGNGRVSYLNIALDAEDAVNMRPCAFDDIGERIVSDDLTTSEYDSEAAQSVAWMPLPELYASTNKK